MSGRWIVLLVVAVCGVGLAAFLREPSEIEPVRPSAPAPAATKSAELRRHRAEVAHLEAELAAANEQRRALEEERDWLLEELRDLRETAAPEQGAQEVEDDTEAGFDVEALLAAGFDPVEIDELRERLDAIALERLYLRDAAQREGWLGTQRWRRERRALDATVLELRDELGEDLFDWGLYAGGQANRVQVSSVLRDSAAAEAGIEAGDLIVEYDGQRILQGKDLRAGVVSGRAGQPTEVLIQRDGTTHRLFVPRGPLGVRFEAIVLRPPPR
jgi:hypothetical protein